MAEREASKGAAPGRLRIGGTIPLAPLDRARAGAWADDLRQAADAAGLHRLASLMAAAADADFDAPEPLGDAVRIAAVLDLSPYLNGQILQHPEWLDQLFDTDAGSIVDARIADLSRFPIAGEGEAALMQAMRLAKREVSLLVALRDLFGAAGPRESTAHLSALAEAAVGAALRFCLREAARTGKLRQKDDDAPEAGSGVVVLGMGKLGGGELNYSSDIDLVVFFDPDAGLAADPSDAVDIFSRLTRRLVKIIGERTADGYVFRTDLRLRPDPGATPLAISTDMALTYYEGSGRNWERAAMIKARPIAGDRAAGEAFLAELSPFVWRRYLDFAAIADIEAMKSRIDDHRGFSAVSGKGRSVAGHDVKLGRGGIREIEFFAQGQQLIAGGRAPKLRQRRTEAALAALAESGWVSARAAGELTGDYWFLRRVEHAIQMIADEQTHVLPQDDEGLERVARLLGYRDRASFEADLLAASRRVDRHFGDLFGGRRVVGGSRHAQGGDSGGAGNRSEDAVFLRLLSSEDDPDALAALHGLGYQRPGDVGRIVRSWGFGRYRATRAEDARKRLAEVLPLLLTSFSRARDPDGAIASFDAFLKGLPAGIQFFALIASNPRILDLLALIITSAPVLRETIAARPHVFDALLDPAFFDEVPDKAVMAERLSSFLADCRGYEDRLARLRIFAAEQRFLVGARLLSGVVDLAEAGPAFTDIADVALSATLDTVAAAFAERHGSVAGGRIALIGMGRLGSRELTATSDIDLILVYDHDPDAEQSDGEKPLPVALYYARLTQRLIAALTAPMGEGILYAVDFRLRPSGYAGPLATSFKAFCRYQREEAWTWERMALTRSRPVAGDRGLCEEMAWTIRALIAERTTDDDVAVDVAAMRRRIEREKPARGPLDLKQRAGGPIDLEFLAQWAILSGRADLALVGCPTAEVLAVAFGEEPVTLEGVPNDVPIGDGGDERSLAATMKTFGGVLQLLRLGPPEAAGFGDMPPGLSDRIASELGVADVEALPPILDDMTKAVRSTFERLLPMAEE